MVHIPDNLFRSLDPQSRAEEVGLCEAELKALRAVKEAIDIPFGFLADKVIIAFLVRSP